MRQGPRGALPLIALGACREVFLGPSGHRGLFSRSTSENSPNEGGHQPPLSIHETQRPDDLPRLRQGFSDRGRRWGRLSVLLTGGPNGRNGGGESGLRTGFTKLQTPRSATRSGTGFLARNRRADAPPAFHSYGTTARPTSRARFPCQWQRLTSARQPGPRGVIPLRLGWTNKGIRYRASPR